MNPMRRLLGALFGRGDFLLLCRDIGLKFLDPLDAQVTVPDDVPLPAIVRKLAVFVDHLPAVSDDVEEPGHLGRVAGELFLQLLNLNCPPVCWHCRVDRTRTMLGKFVLDPYSDRFSLKESEPPLLTFRVIAGFVAFPPCLRGRALGPVAAGARGHPCALLSTR